MEERLLRFLESLRDCTENATATVISAHAVSTTVETEIEKTSLSSEQKKAILGHASAIETFALDYQETNRTLNHTMNKLIAANVY